MKQAVISKIDSVAPIEGADLIERVMIGGWQCVVKKGQFNVGDLCVYVEVDGLLPIQDRYEFLRKSSYKKLEDGTEWFRLKTIKLRGTLSQGLAMPISDFPEFENVELIIGMDVTELLGIKHYEKPVPANLAGVVRGNFPSFIIKTDEINIQSCKAVIDEMQGLGYVATMKIDGSSGTFYKKDNDFGVCSRRINLKESNDNTFWQMAYKYNLQNIPDGIAIQGEVAGPGIQENKMGFKELDLYIFNVIQLEGHRYFNYDEFIKFCQEMDLKIAPIVKEGIFNFKNVDELLEVANELKYPNGTPAEGIVIRPTIEQYSNTLKGRLSFKVVSNVFRLKYGE